MISLLALLASTVFAPVSDGVASEIRQAIWRDLQRNAFIGSGNWVGALWYNASKSDPDKPDLHIEDLRCRTSDKGYRCAFVLLRDGGEVMELNEVAPDRLACSARLEGVGGALSVKHLPPRGAGHSRTTMTCRRA